MVSNQKIRFFAGRVEGIEHKKREQIEQKYPKIETDYTSLIANGQSKMKSEEEIRKIIGHVSHYSCPPMVEVLSLFEFNGEREKAKKAEEKRLDQIEKEKSALKAKVKVAMDLVYFGTDEQLKAALEELEA
jgi:hypothetical protein